MNIDNMTMKELVETYNELSDTPVKKFKDLATARRRVKELNPKPKSSGRKGRPKSEYTVKYEFKGDRNPKKVTKKLGELMEQSKTNTFAEISATVVTKRNNENASDEALKFRYYQIAQCGYDVVCKNRDDKVKITASSLA